MVDVKQLIPEVTVEVDILLPFVEAPSPVSRCLIVHSLLYNILDALYHVHIHVCAHDNACNFNSASHSQLHTPGMLRMKLVNSCSCTLSNMLCQFSL